MGKKGFLILISMLLVLNAAAAVETDCGVVSSSWFEAEIFSCSEPISANIIFNNTGPELNYDLSWAVYGSEPVVLTDKQELNNKLPEKSDVTWAVSAVPKGSSWPGTGFYTLRFVFNATCGNKRQGIQKDMITFVRCGDIANPEADAGVEFNSTQPLQNVESESPAAPYSGDSIITVVEGETVKIKVKAIDPDNDAVKIMYSEPLDADGEWETQIGDTGTYTANITASDGKLMSMQKITIIVKKVNRAPLLSVPEEIQVNEGELVVITANTTDPDSDKVYLTYSGWINKKQYATAAGDAGQYYVTVTASDTKLEVSRKIRIIVNPVNHAPVLNVKSEYLLSEGNVLVISLNAIDRDSDKLTYKAIDMPAGASFANNTFRYMPGFDVTAKDETKEFTMYFEASDSKVQVRKPIVIRVVNKNRKPRITNVSRSGIFDISEAVRFFAEAGDMDRDVLSYKWSFSLLESYAGSSSYVRKFTVPGRKHVSVEVSDGTDTALYSWDIDVVAGRKVYYPKIAGTFVI